MRQSTINGKMMLKLLGFSLFTGATFNLAQYTVQYFNAPAAAAWRFGLAAVIMLAVLAWKERISLANLKQNGWMYALLGLIGICGFNALFFWGMTSTTPVNGALIMATNPLVTAILARVILGDKISRSRGAGIAVSLLGVVFVITHGSWEMIRTLAFSKGDLLIFLGNLCWALYGVLGRRFVKGSTSLSTTSYTMVVGAAFLAVISVSQPGPLPLSSIPLAAWAAISFMSIFTTVLGYLWWNQAMAQLGASKTSIFFNLVPVVTMFISFFTGHEVTVIQIAGALLVFAGVLIASGVRAGNKPADAKLAGAIGNGNR